MRIKRDNEGISEGDLTPMIDMTFQLIAFFMVLINFTEAEQDKRINLPSSELAKPPDQAFEEQRTLQLTKDGTVLFGGDEVPVDNLGPLLLREVQVLRRTPDKSVSMVTVIIRADSDAETGKVQDLIKICQKNQFEKFALRAEQEKSSSR